MKIKWARGLFTTIKVCLSLKRRKSGNAAKAKELFQCFTIQSWSAETKWTDNRNFVLLQLMMRYQFKIIFLFKSTRLDWAIFSGLKFLKKMCLVEGTKWNDWKNLQIYFFSLTWGRSEKIGIYSGITKSRYVKEWKQVWIFFPPIRIIYENLVNCTELFESVQYRRYPKVKWKKKKNWGKTKVEK